MKRQDPAAQEREARIHRQYILALKALLAHADLGSIEELAEAVGMPKSYLTKSVEDKGIWPAAQFLAGVVEPFGITLSTFFRWGEDAYRKEQEGSIVGKVGA